MKKIIILIFVLFSLSGCFLAPKLNLSLDEETMYLFVDKEVRLSTRYNSQNVFWTTSDEEIATVDTSGMLTPKKEGVVMLNAYNQGTILVLRLTGIVSIKEEISILGPQECLLDENIDLTAKVIPNNLNQEVTWESLDEEIATVSTDGVVTGVSCGLVRIKATSVENEELVAEREILVYNETLDSVEDEIDINISLENKTLDLSTENNFLEPVIKK